MPKNKPRQEIKKGFLLFHLEWHQNGNKLGNRMTLEEAKKGALPTWPKLRKEEREEYEKKAGRIDLEAWLNDSIAVDTARAKKQQDARAREDEEMKNWLEKIFGSEGWHQQIFTFFSVAHFVKTEKKIFPGEIALAKFNLKDGVIDTMQMRIDPGLLPSGSTNEAQLTSDETHKMPLPPQCGGESDWTKIKAAVKKFINDGKKPLLFVKQHAKCQDLDAARKTLLEIWQIADDEIEVGESLPRVCALEELLFRMAAKSGASKNFRSIENAREFLDKNSLSADACKFHEEQDVPSFCCLSRVLRWAYWISKHCLDPKLLVPGKHLAIPPEVKKEEEEITSFMLNSQKVDESFEGSFEESIGDESPPEEPDKSMASQNPNSTNPFQSKVFENHNMSSSNNPFLQDNQDTYQKQEETETEHADGNIQIEEPKTSDPEPVGVSAFDFESLLMFA